MTMKKIIILLASIFILLQACDDVLDINPTDQLSLATFGGTETDLVLAANALYSGLPGLPNLDTRSYLYTIKRGFNSRSDGSYATYNSDGDWNRAYERIRRANFLLENAGLALEKGISENTVNRYKGEAYFFRAYAYYMELIVRWGDVPFVTKVLNLGSEELYGPRTSRTEIVDQILEDLNTAAGNLPKQSELSASEHGRITKNAAMALRARIALWEGTHAKYHNHGKPAEHLQIAKESAKQLMDMGENELAPDYATLFTKEYEMHSEVIFSRKYGVDVSTYEISAHLQNADRVPTKAFADLFLDNTGLPISHQESVFEGYETLNSEYKNRDPRMLASFFIPYVDDLINQPNYVPELFGSNPTMTGYLIKKRFNKETAWTWKETVDNYLIRYAEVLLIYAEAVYELDGNISDDDLDISINKLRERVSLPYLTNAFVTAKGLDMLEEIRRERRVELCFEGGEFEDQKRWKISHIESPKPIRGIKFHADVYPDITVSTVPGEASLLIDEDGFLLWQQAKDRQWLDKHYLEPIPLEQIRLNDKLTQNSGWN